MSQDNGQSGQPPAWVPEAKEGACYKNGWHQLWNYPLELLLITIVGFVISLPSHGFSAAKEVEGAGAYFLSIFALAYTLLLVWPVGYGISFAYLKAARGEQPSVKDVFDAL